MRPLHLSVQRHYSDNRYSDTGSMSPVHFSGSWGLAQGRVPCYGYRDLMSTPLGSGEWGRSHLWAIFNTLFHNYGAL
jgi:hypothetical protein